MTFRNSFSSCLLVLLVGCSGTSLVDEPASTSEPASNGVAPTTNGSAVDPGAAAAGNESISAAVDAPGDPEASGDPMGEGAEGALAAGSSKCGAPLDATAPTATSVRRDGPFSVTSYSRPASSTYRSLNVQYPTNATGPFVVVMISPGLTEVLAYLQQWSRRFASYGYVAVFVEANNTNSDSEAMRADGLWAAIQTIKAENTRAGSPLAGKLSDCIVTSGHSLGGGASISVANAHPTAIKGALGFNPYDPSQTFGSIVAPTLIVTGQNDTTASPAAHGRRQYDSMSTRISKEYVEVAGGNHQAALFPSTYPGQYAIAWIKYTVDGDARYRPFLNKATSGLSAYATTLP